VTIATFCCAAVATSTSIAAAKIAAAFAYVIKCSANAALSSCVHPSY
jgi:hypothetical protein